VYCCKAVQFPVLLFCEVLPNLTTFQTYTVYFDLYFIVSGIYNFCTGGSSENNDKILFEPHRMVCSYRHEAKLVCTATFDKEECAGRQTDDTSPSCVSFMKFLQGAHGIKSFFAE
jgi:hypothetical protein